MIFAAKIDRRTFFFFLGCTRISQCCLFLHRVAECCSCNRCWCIISLVRKRWYCVLCCCFISFTSMYSLSSISTSVLHRNNRCCLETVLNAFTQSGCCCDTWWLALEKRHSSTFRRWSWYPLSIRCQVHCNTFSSWHLICSISVLLTSLLYSRTRTHHPHQNSSTAKKSSFETATILNNDTCLCSSFPLIEENELVSYRHHHHLHRPYGSISWWRAEPSLQTFPTFDCRSGGTPG